MRFWEGVLRHIIACACNIRTSIENTVGIKEYSCPGIGYYFVHAMLCVCGHECLNVRALAQALAPMLAQALARVYTQVQA